MKESNARQRESRLKNNGNAMIELKKRVGIMSRSDKGFTFVEIIIVLGLLTMLAGFSVFIGLDGYRGYAFRTERAVLVSTLQKARAESLNNVNQSPHGVRFSTNDYVLFEGTDYLSRDSSKDETVTTSYGVTFSGSPEIVFEQLSGDSTDSSVALTDGIRTVTVSINGEGRISY